MQLHYPVQTMVLFAKMHEHAHLVLTDLLTAQLLSCHLLCKYCLNFVLGDICICNIFQTMIADTATCFLEVFHSLGKRSLDIRKRCDLHICCLSQFLHIWNEIVFFNIDSLIRSPWRQYFYIKGLICCDHLVPVQIVNRIICGSDHFYIGIQDQLSCRHGL